MGPNPPHTKSGNAKMYGLEESMGYQRYGLRESRLYSYQMHLRGKKHRRVLGVQSVSLSTPNNTYKSSRGALGRHVDVAHAQVNIMNSE